MEDSVKKKYWILYRLQKEWYWSNVSKHLNIFVDYYADLTAHIINGRMYCWRSLPPQHWLIYHSSSLITHRPLYCTEYYFTIICYIPYCWKASCSLIIIEHWSRFAIIFCSFQHQYGTEWWYYSNSNYPTYQKIREQEKSHFQQHPRIECHRKLVNQVQRWIVVLK